MTTTGRSGRGAPAVGRVGRRRYFFGVAVGAGVAGDPAGCGVAAAVRLPIRIGVSAPEGVRTAVGEGCGWTVGVLGPAVGEVGAAVGAVGATLGVVTGAVGVMPGGAPAVGVGEAGCPVANAVGAAAGDPTGVADSAGPLVATADGFGDGAAVGGT
jgi:hypothetical protein